MTCTTGREGSGAGGGSGRQGQGRQGPPFATYWPDSPTGTAGLWREFQRGHGDCHTSFVRYFGEMILKMERGQPVRGAEFRALCLWKGRASLRPPLDSSPRLEGAAAVGLRRPAPAENLSCSLPLQKMNVWSWFVAKLTRVWAHVKRCCCLDTLLRVRPFRNGVVGPNFDLFVGRPLDRRIHWWFCWQSDSLLLSLQLHVKQSRVNFSLHLTNIFIFIFLRKHQPNVYTHKHRRWNPSLVRIWLESN